MKLSSLIFGHAAGSDPKSWKVRMKLDHGAYGAEDSGLSMDRMGLIQTMASLMDSWSSG